MQITPEVTVGKWAEWGTPRKEGGVDWSPLLDQTLQSVLTHAPLLLSVHKHTDVMFWLSLIHLRIAAVDLFIIEMWKPIKF